MYPGDLTEEQWAVLKPYVVKPLPVVQGKGRPPKQDFRTEINGMLYVLETGCQWRMLPTDFPPWKTVYGYLRRRRLDGAWDTVPGTSSCAHCARRHGFNPRTQGRFQPRGTGHLQPPFARTPLTIDVGVQGCFGQHEGVTGGLKVNYKF